ncbi:chromosome partitioning protein ParB [Capnocytophaga canimorsus]|uniref:chromosome partitioning protein ParB n=1 Tax=Capnocytophaga canimorsus TaxID=28188 RepID=UPI0037D1792C
MENKEYQDFVDKFKPKKTTDDCYTPPSIYDVILNYVKERCNIEGMKVLRPFYPGGDYENEDYTEDCVVVDNPPFSIISQIIRFYNQRNIKYFLFAPHLTLFSSDQDYTGIVVGSDIIYENGAKVKTSFVSNLFGDVKILGDSYLYERLKQTQGENKKCLPRYIYPDNLITVADVTKIVAQGGSITINKKEVAHCRALESQKPFKKTIFGSGFIMSDEATERMKTERIKAKKEIITWTLSDREKELVKTLG